uniref:Protein yippee-like n=1 Tax=Rhizophora mucronata TaxID=61149 RepID=A0A2P2K2F4_RHIMU
MSLFLASFLYDILFMIEISIVAFLINPYVCTNADFGVTIWSRGHGETVCGESRRGDLQLQAL